MTTNGSDRYPLMPTDVGERATQAWRAGHKALAGVDHATEAFFEVTSEVRALRKEGDARETRAEAWRETISRQMMALTEATRRVRRSTSSDSEETIRNELPTLPEIILDDVRVVVRSKRGRMVWGWMVKGAGKAITALVTLAIMAAAGYLARDLVGPHAARVVAHEAVPR